MAILYKEVIKKMYSINEYDELLNSAIKKLSGKKYEDRYKNLINDVKDLLESINVYNNKEMSYSTIMYQVRYLKNLYNEQLKEIIYSYQEIALPDFSSKNDPCSIINSPQSLKTWMLRYMCYKIVNIDLSMVIKEKLNEQTITNKYQEIDSYLFSYAFKKKVTNK